MDKGKRNIIILLGVIAMAALIYFVWLYSPDSRHNWDELYRHNDDKPQPYSSEVILDLLEGYFPDNEVTVMDKKRLAEALPIDTTGEAGAASYVLIGENMYPDSADTEQLFDFVERGNTAFIAVKEMHYRLSRELYARACDSLEVEENGEEKTGFEKIEELEFEEIEEVVIDSSFYVFDGDTVYIVDEDGDSYDYEDIEDWYSDDDDDDDYYYDSGQRDTVVYMNFTHPKLKRDTAYTYQYVYRNKPKSYYWRHWNAPELCDSSQAFISLGYMKPEQTNFIKIPYGKGSFLFHSNPIVFTNYHLLDEDAVAYASSVFSHLPEGDIYWDEKTKNYRFEFPGGGNRDFMQSPLSYILSQQSLRWAWYLMLGLVLLFVLFRAKRKQRIIPIRAANTNTSLEFVQTIGRLYHQQQDHKNLTEKMMYLFKDFVRRRYAIRLKDRDEKTMNNLITKSEIPEPQVQEIFTRYSRMSRAEEVSESHLTNFYLALERFYKNCK